ncbi:MAG: BMC domain-containing protein [Elusimicrobiota bacterium]|nr:BMC domain-containing protein [Elusimicrobiota bacterium]
MKSIGGVEVSSIAKGLEVADAMLKTSNVTLLLSRSICSGKYIALISGDVGSVKSSVDAGVKKAAHSIVDSFMVPNIHPDVFPAISQSVEVDKLEALGIIEAFSISVLIEAADAAAKAATIKLIEVRLAMALGGKAFVTFTGSIAATQTAADAGADIVGKRGLLVEKVVIAKPREELLKELL